MSILLAPPSLLFDWRPVASAASSGPGGTIPATGNSQPATFGVRDAMPSNVSHHPAVVSVGTSAPSGSPAVPAGTGDPTSFKLRSSLTIQNQHATNTLSVFFGSTSASPFLLAPGASLTDYGQDAVWFQASGSTITVFIDPVY
jgi:hypothetical protein